ncbi:MAG: regulatory protein [Clostridiales bacterium]|nr:regulatory protein [Clostridiales bacterium]MDN5299604.1 regulatory protein [Clostridiales bacterium]
MRMTPLEKCINDAYGILARQDRTIAEMQEKLTVKNHEADVIAMTIERLIEQALLDDAAYAVQYVRSHRNRHGDYRMRQKLLQKGISERDYQQAKAILSEEDDFETAAVIDTLIRKKCEQIALDRKRYESDYAYRQKSAAKLMRFLAGRGFELGAVRDGLRRVLASDGIDED